MAQLFGKTYRREELMRLTGDISQIAGTKQYELLEGKGRGVKAVDFWTGTGLVFTILLDRAMDISEARYCGKSLCWRSPAGDAHPHFFDPRGLEWLRTFFGGLLTTCGITYCGSPCRDEGEDLGLHGRISHVPADKVCLNEEWLDDDYVLSVTGKMREGVNGGRRTSIKGRADRSAVPGEDMLLTRTITTRLGESRLWIHDVVENQCFQRRPLMMHYHLNGGFPAVDEGARLISPTREVRARDEVAETDKDDFAKFTAPVPGCLEKDYYHEMAADADGLVRCALINENIEDGFGFYVTYKKSQLPWFIEWKMMGERDYVVGMDPANCSVEGRDKERQSGTLQFLEPGERQEYDLEIGILDGKQSIEAFEKLVAAVS